MKIIEKKDKLICSYDSSDERDKHIMDVCTNGYICTSISGDAKHLKATFVKKSEDEDLK